MRPVAYCGETDEIPNMLRLIKTTLTLQQLQEKHVLKQGTATSTATTVLTSITSNTRKEQSYYNTCMPFLDCQHSDVVTALQVSSLTTHLPRRNGG